MESDMWATLPCDLLLDIFRHLGSTAIIRCAGVCRPWRRAIIDNAALCLRPRPDGFLPGLFLAFVDTSWHRRLTRQGRLEYVPRGGPSSDENVFTLELEGVDVSQYDDTLRPLTSRDGFLLFWADSAASSNNLFLWNPHAGARSCRLLSAAALGASSSGRRCTYILVTGGADVRILAVESRQNIKDGMTFQVVSSTSGVWGPVKRSPMINVTTYIIAEEDKRVAVCAPWLRRLLAGHQEHRQRSTRMCVRQYGYTLLASRDGFLLLQFRRNTVGNDHHLCLCNLLAGSCRLLSVATALGKSSFSPRSYVLTTAYDDDEPPPGVRILAVRGQEHENRVAYQIFSSTSGVWGPVKRSAKLMEKDMDKVSILTEPCHHAVVCGGGSGSVVYWLAYMLPADEEADDDCTCVVAMDTRTERTWTTELPKEWANPFMALVLVTSEDGRRLSLIAAQSQGAHHKIEVWVLAGDDSRWMLQLTMNVKSWLFPSLPHWGEIWLGGFCPRSGCLFAIATDKIGRRQQFVIGVDGSSPRLIETAGPESLFALRTRWIGQRTYQR